MRDFSQDHRALAINSATVKALNLQQLCDACVRAGITTIAPWRDQIQAVGISTAGKIIKDAGLGVTSLVRAGLFTAASEAGRKAAIDDNRRAVDEAAGIGAANLLLIAGGLPPGSKDIAGARQQVHDGLATLLPYAKSANMPLALKPLHPMTAADRGCVTTLGNAKDICDELGDGLGVAIDVYHVWWDPTLPQEIARAGKRILGFHVCDWLVPTTDLLTDRGMMGDGIIDIKSIRGMVEAAGYDAPVDVEIFSANNWWKRDADEVLRICIERFRSVV